MYKNLTNRVDYHEYSLDEKDPANVGRLYQVADSLAVELCRDEFGHVRSDMQIMLSTVDPLLQAKLAAQIKEVPSAPANSLTDEELISITKSRYCQAPSEVIAYNERVLAKRDAYAASNPVEPAVEQVAPSGSDVDTIMDNV